MEINTHLAIDPDWVGKPVRCEEGAAECVLTTRTKMAADDRGLVHGGFVFGLADYAAMLAVGDPTVVLGSADVRFTAPVTVGETVHARASLTGGAREPTKKRTVDVVAAVGDREVFRGTFTCFVLETHVLDTRET